MSDKCRTECAASLSTWDADPSVSPTAGMSGLQWLMMETLTLHHFRQHASAGYCCHYRKNYIFFDREIVHDIFFSIGCPEKPTRGSPHDSCGCSVCQPEPICWQWAGKQTLSLCNCEKLPEHDTTIRWSAMVQTTSKTLVCITHIYTCIYGIYM